MLTKSLFILLIAASFRFYTVASTAVTTDEALTYQRTVGSLQDRLEHIAGPGNHVPLYFLSVELLPHEIDIGLRYGSLLLGILGIALTIRVVYWLYHDSNLALVVGLWIAVSPFMVYYSRDARPYAMLMVASLLVSVLFLQILAGKRSLLMWTGFVLITLMAYTIHYAAAALPLTQFVVLLWQREKITFIGRWIGAQAIASVPTFLWILTFAEPKSESTDWIDIPNIGRPYYTLTNITLGYEAVAKWYFLIMLIPVTAGVFYGIRFVWQNQRPANRYWLTLPFIPMIFVFLVSQLAHFSNTVSSIYFERYFMVTAPGIFILVALGLREMSVGMAFNLWATVVIVLTAGVTLNELATTHFEPQDWRQSTRFVLENIEDGDIIFVDGPHETAFWHYYRGNPEEQVLSGATVDRLYTTQSSICDLNAPRVWLMTGNTLNDYTQRLVAEENFTYIRDYYRITVRLINCKD
jgi:mannosyltransferase